MEPFEVRSLEPSEGWPPPRGELPLVVESRDRTAPELLEGLLRERGAWTRSALLRHNELSHLPDPPRHVFFACLGEPSRDAADEPIRRPVRMFAPDRLGHGGSDDHAGTS
jgi:hypothetical protein